MAVTGFVAVQYLADLAISDVSDPAGLVAEDGAAFVMVRLGLPFLAALAWLWFVAVWGDRRGWAAVGLRPLDGHWVRWGVFTGLASTMLVAVLAILSRPLLGEPVELPVPLRPGSVEPTLWFVLAFASVAGGLVPVVEEVASRGVMYGWLRHRIGVLPGALVSATVHGLMHGDLARAVPLIGAFVLFALLYERAGSLWAPIAAHATHNVATLMLALALTAGQFTPSG